MADASEFAEKARAPHPRTRRQRIGGGWSPLTWLAVAALGGAIFFLAWAIIEGWPSPVTSTDIDQHRLNTALAPPNEGRPIAQSFLSRHDGLSEVEVLLARSAQSGGEDGQVRLRLLDDQGAVVVDHRWATQHLQHNQPLVLRFSPQEASLGREYRIILEGSAQNPFGLWAYDLNVYDDGALDVEDSDDAVSGDLRFVTRYRLQLRAALQELGGILVRDGGVLILSLLLLPLPGFLLLLIMHRRLLTIDRMAWWGLALATGLAVWPLLWFWLTLAGGRWARSSLILFVIIGWLTVVAVVLRRGVYATRLWPISGTSILLILLFIVALGVRLLAVRDLTFPPWVDSSRHALITTIMAESGQAPSDYHPYLPIDDFSYHFGFHALAASLEMLLASPLPRVLLVLGQLLNALAPLTVYSGVWLLTRRRSAALIASFLVALPFFFPAYYATWGRYTQLSGALLLAPLVGLTWLLARGVRGWRSVWWLVGLLTAGLFLVHVRVFLIYLVFAALAASAAWTRQHPLRHAYSLLIAALWGLALIAPRIWQLARSSGAGAFLTPSGASYAQFPAGYVSTGWERWFLALGALAFIALSLVAVRPVLRRKINGLPACSRQRRAFVAVALGGWTGLAALTLSGLLPGLPALWLININSAYILLFVPLAFLLALAFDQSWSLLKQRSSGPRALGVLSVLAMLFGAAVAASTLFGARQQIGILNETTILAYPADSDALVWVGENLPDDARIAVNSWRWLGATWAASDGGAWIPPLTGLATTTPPVDYIGSPVLFQRVIAFNEAAAAVEDWSEPQNANWLSQQGISHIYVGARGGFFDPAALVRNPRVELLYDHDGVFVFAIGD